MEKCNKHESILKAASLISAPSAPSPKSAPAKLFIEADELEKAALMGKVFGYFKKSLPLTEKAVDDVGRAFCPNRKELMKKAKMGRDSYYKYIKELAAYGYIEYWPELCEGGSRVRMIGLA
jgi:hypothetical protein